MLCNGKGESVDSGSWSCENAHFQIHPPADVGYNTIESKGPFSRDGSTIANLNVEVDSIFSRFQVHESQPALFHYNIDGTFKIQFKGNPYLIFNDSYYYQEDDIN